MNRISSFLREFFPYLAVFVLGGLAVSPLSPFATISRQTQISSITHDSVAFPIAVGTSWHYEGTLRQQQGQEQNPPVEAYVVNETVIQHDQARNGTAKLISLRHEESRGGKAPVSWTVGYLTDGIKFYRIENEDGLNAVRKSFYGDDSDRDIIAELSRTPTYELPADTKGCFVIKNPSLSSTYEETFCVGIGPIAMTFIHNGSIDEYTLHLTNFSTP